jgi:ABC-type branched-subunit amino acid transport system substrate-binding protein
MAKDTIEDFNTYVDFHFIDLGPESNLIDKLEEGKKKGCSVYTGLITSQESLIAGPWLMKNKLFGISPTATVQKLETFYPYFRTLMAPSGDFAKTIYSFLLRKLPSKVYIISFIDDYYSLNISRDFISAFSNSRILSDLIKIPKGGKIDDNKLQEIMNAKRSIVLFTGYYYGSLNVLNQMGEYVNIFNNNQNLIVGAPSWSFDDNLFTSTIKIDSFHLVYFPYLWKADKNTNFFKEYVKKYAVEPRSKAVLSYDVMNIIFRCAKKSPHNQNQVITCLQKKISFEGQSGHILFEKGNTHASPTIYVKNMRDNNG